MIVSDYGQARVFVINVIFGIMCVVFFDFCSAMGKRYGKTTIVINIIDLLYYLCAFAAIFYAGVKYNFGAFRYYQLLGLLLGMVGWYVLFSRMERRLMLFLTDKIIIIFKTVAKALLKPVLFLVRLVFTPLVYAEEQEIKMSKKINKRLEKIAKKRKKSTENVKKRLKMM